MKRKGETEVNSSVEETDRRRVLRHGEALYKEDVNKEESIVVFRTVSTGTVSYTHLSLYHQICNLTVGN